MIIAQESGEVERMTSSVHTQDLTTSYLSRLRRRDKLGRGCLLFAALDTMSLVQDCVTLARSLGPR